MLTELQIRRVARHVGQLAGMLDATQHLSNSCSSAQVQQVFEDGSVFLGQAQGGRRQRVDVRVWRRLDSHPERAIAFDRRAVEHTAVVAAEDRRLATIRQSAGLLDVGDGAQAGKPTVDARHEHDQAIGLSRGQNGRAGTFNSA